MGSTTCARNLWMMATWFLALMRSHLDARRKKLRRESLRSNGIPSAGRNADRSALVTGADGALGKEIVFRLILEGYHVLLACKGEGDAISLERECMLRYPRASVEAFRLDLEDPTSIDQLASRLLDSVKERPAIELLIHNAACMGGGYRTTKDGFERTWTVDFLGPCLLTLRLRDLLDGVHGARVVFVSSFTHRCATKKSFLKWLEWMETISEDRRVRDFLPASAYQHSKLACLLLLFHLAEFLGGDVCVYAVDPGAFESRLTREWPAFLVHFYLTVLRCIGLLLPVSEAAERTAGAILASTASTGSYWFQGCRMEPSIIARDEELSRRLIPWLHAFAEASLDGVHGVRIPGIHPRSNAGITDAAWTTYTPGSPRAPEESYFSVEGRGSWNDSWSEHARKVS